MNIGEDLTDKKILKMFLTFAEQKEKLYKDKFTFLVGIKVNSFFIYDLID